MGRLGAPNREQQKEKEKLWESRGKIRGKPGGGNTYGKDIVKRGGGGI